MYEKMSMKDKVVIITGAGKGIGYETAKIFASLQCKVAVISRNNNDLIKLKNELKLDHNDLYTMAGDVSIPATVKEFVSETYERFGKIDVLINNAGMRFRKSFLSITYEEWKNVMDVNLGSTFLFCQEVGPYMIKQKSGRIINMASIVGTLGLPELTGYAASKGAIISLTKSLAVEWAKYNININVLAPGFCKTSYSESFKQKSDLYEFTIERTPMKKWGESKDIANACLYLASDLSNYVTGETLNIDGGWSAW